MAASGRCRYINQRGSISPLVYELPMLEQSRHLKPPKNGARDDGRMIFRKRRRMKIANHFCRGWAPDVLLVLAAAMPVCS